MSNYVGRDFRIKMSDIKIERLHVIIFKFEIHDKIDYIYSNNGVKIFREGGKNSIVV